MLFHYLMNTQCCFPVCSVLYFSLTAFKIFSLALAFSSLSVMCRSLGNLGSLFLHIFFSDFLHFPPMPSPLLLASPSGIPITCVLDCLISSHRSLRLCPFSFSLFPLCFMGWLISIYLSSSSQILSPTASNKLLSLSSEVFIYVILLFNSRISIWFFSVVPFSLLYCHLFTD